MFRTVSPLMAMKLDSLTPDNLIESVLDTNFESKYDHVSVPPSIDVPRPDLLLDRESSFEPLNEWQNRSISVRISDLDLDELF